MRIRGFFISLFVGFLLVGLGGCSKDALEDEFWGLPVVYGDGALLKQVWASTNGEMESAWLSQVYEYDGKGRISRISRPSYVGDKRDGWVSYDEYRYNEKGQLSEIAFFSQNVSGIDVNLWTAYYEYDKNGLKVKELKKYPEIGTSEETLFLYKQGRLVRMDEYDSGGDLSRYTEYEYDKGNRLSKELVFNGNPYQVHEYSVYGYENGMNTSIDVYILPNRGKEYTELRKITKEYDSKGRLVRVNHNEMWWASSMMGGTWLYEYE